MKKEINIVAPEGFEIDKEHSTFECIKFKPIEKKKWRDNEDAPIKGYYITLSGHISDQFYGKNIEDNFGLFASKRQTKSAIAMARISQIMANDERFGGVITNEEWRDDNMRKYVIIREKDNISVHSHFTYYHFLAFRTAEQRDLFLDENEDLLKDYFMLD